MVSSVMYLERWTAHSSFCSSRIACPANRCKRLEAPKTGDGRPLPAHLQAQVGRVLDRVELLPEQIEAVEAARDAMLAAVPVASPAPAMLLDLKGIGPELPPSCGRRGSSRHSDNRRQVAAYALPFVRRC